MNPIEPEKWMDSALCTQVSPDLFFSEKKGLRQ